MGDKNNGLSAALELAQDLEQLVHFLGCQHGGRLVQYDDVRAAVECLEDLHPLHHAYGQIFHFFVQVDLEAETFYQLLHIPPAFLPVQDKIACFFSQDDVFQHSQLIDQHEMLMDHTDPFSVGIIWVGDLCFFLINKDFTCVRVVQAEQDVHQGTFPGPVFTQQAVDLLLLYNKIYSVIGPDTAEALDDPDHFNRVHVILRCVFIPSYAEKLPAAGFPYGVSRNLL